jgi:anti-anti-sigma factor
MSFEMQRSNGDGPVTTYAVAGELDIAVADEVIRELRAARQANARVLLDLSGVTFIDSSGLRALLVSAKNGDGHGADVVLARPSQTVSDLLELSGARRLFTVVDG